MLTVFCQSKFDKILFSAKLVCEETQWIEKHLKKFIIRIFFIIININFLRGWGGGGGGGGGENKRISERIINESKFSAVVFFFFFLL